MFQTRDEPGMKREPCADATAVLQDYRQPQDGPVVHFLGRRA